MVPPSNKIPLEALWPSSALASTAKQGSRELTRTLSRELSLNSNQKGGRDES